jgi:hypothetical protein
MAREGKAQTIRFPQDLAEEMRRIAERETRSFSQQVIHYCKQGVQRDKKGEDNEIQPT